MPTLSYSCVAPVGFSASTPRRPALPAPLELAEAVQQEGLREPAAPPRATNAERADLAAA